MFSALHENCCISVFSFRFSSQLLLVPWTRLVGRMVAGLQFPSSGACLEHA